MTNCCAETMKSYAFSYRRQILASTSFFVALSRTIYASNAERHGIYSKSWHSTDSRYCFMNSLRTYPIAAFRSHRADKEHEELPSQPCCTLGSLDGEIGNYHHGSDCEAYIPLLNPSSLRNIVHILKEIESTLSQCLKQSLWSNRLQSYAAGMA